MVILIVSEYELVPLQIIRLALVRTLFSFYFPLAHLQIVSFTLALLLMDKLKHHKQQCIYCVQTLSS